MGQDQRSRSTAIPTLGYLGSSMIVEQPWQAGLIDAARARHVNLVIFAGGPLEDPHRFDTQRSRIFALAGKENVDGLIVGSDFLGHYVGAERIERFCAQYHPLPIVKYEPLVAGYPTLLFDFYGGMYELVAHLIEEHGLRKIAYISGMEQSRSIADRLRAYGDALAAHGIAYDEKLVVRSAHIMPSGGEAVRVLLDERRLRPGDAVEAVVGFYDQVAADAMQALQARGIGVPHEIAVVGFDDDDIAVAASPRMTTVRLPFYEIGRWGVETLADVLDGKQVDPVTVLPASLVRRKSCGCPVRRFDYEDRPQAAGNRGEGAAEQQGERRGERRAAILEKMLAAAGVRNLPGFRQELARLLDVFLAYADVGTEAGQLPQFAAEVEAVVKQVHSIYYNVDMANAVLAVLQDELLAAQDSDQRRLGVQRLVQNAQLVVSEQIERFLVRERQQAAHLDGRLHELNQVLATALHVEELVEVLARHLPGLGVPACYFSLYEDPEQVGGPAKLMLAYGPEGRTDVPAGGQAFDARQLIPHGLRAAGTPAVLVVLPLFHRQEQMGFVVLEAGPRYGGLYEAVREQISSTLKRIQLHAKMVEARRQAEEANALKSRFLSTVTHELRTPLSMIASLSAALLEKGAAEETRREAQARDLRLIYAIGQHLDRLVLDVLDLGRSQLGQLRLERKIVDLGHLLGEVAETGARMAQEKHLAWRSHIPPALPPVEVDPARIQQVLLNLIGNATKFTLHGEVALLVAVRDGEILVAVSDTGLGIPQADQAIIFDEFRQSERTSARGYGGMGLGLAITRRLVELHGGTMGLHSSGEEGQGATFYFTLPLASGTASTEFSPRGDSVREETYGSKEILQELRLGGAEAPERPLTILLVDDEIDVLRTNSQLIRRRLPQVRVYEASSGRQALDLMERVVPDLLLLDLMMPEVDGFGVLEAMQTQAALQLIPVIVMTGQVLPSQMMAQFQPQVAAVVGKGLFDDAETMQRIAGALQRDRRGGGEAQRIARQAMAYIHTHFALKVTRGDLAQHVGVNERYLTRCFHQEVGVTPIEYLNRYRVKAAKELLARGAQSISEVATETGFAGSSQFSRVFHQYTGMSPRAYRQAQRAP